MALAVHALLQVLYQLFDWPHAPGSRLAVIGISNTHDLDQRVLPRIASRLDQAKLAFAPYGVAQLTTIVRGRLHASGVGGAVEETAVQLACRKVASETGADGGTSGRGMHALPTVHHPMLAPVCCRCQRGCPRSCSFWHATWHIRHNKHDTT
jgi:hypothetical protein